MATFSLDWRERMVSAYDQGEGTRDEVARRFGVSLGMVKKAAPTAAQDRLHQGPASPRRTQKAHWCRAPHRHSQAFEAQTRRARALEAHLP